VIEFRNYYEGYSERTHPGTIPDNVRTVNVLHDGGRLTIEINGQVVFHTTDGLDCQVIITKDLR